MKLIVTPVFQGRKLPVEDPEVIFFGCIDRRLVNEGAFVVEKLLGYKKGQYFEYKTKGSLNGFINDELPVRNRAFKTLRLAVDNGAKVVVLTAHTKCAADKKKGPQLPELEIDYQKDKLEKALRQVNDYIRAKAWTLEVYAYLYEVYDVRNGFKANIYSVELKPEEEADTSEIAAVQTSRQSSAQQRAAVA